MKTYYLEKLTNNWNETTQKQVNWDNFFQEPHFQLTILDINLPLIVNNEFFYPLCKEFDKGDAGVDMIYISPKGKFIFAEYKHKPNYSPIRLVQETCFKFKQNEQFSVSYLLKYLVKRPKEVSERIAFKFTAWLSNLNLEKTFRELFFEDKIILASIVYGEPKESLINAIVSPLYTFGVSISQNRDYAKIISYSTSRLDKNCAYENIVHFSSDYDKYLKDNVKNKRTKRNRDNIISYIEELPSNSTIKKNQIINIIGISNESNKEKKLSKNNSVKFL